MLKSIQQRDLQKNRWIKITMTVILLLICGSMLFYLIPGLTNATSGDNNPDSVAVVGGQPITVVEVQRQIAQMEHNGPVPPMMRSIYSRQIIDQLIFQQALYLEADRLGIRVTPQELTERIKQILPTAWAGDTWLKGPLRQPEVASRTGMQRQPSSKASSAIGMLAEKFRAAGHRRNHREPRGNRTGISPTQRESSIEYAAHQARRSGEPRFIPRTPSWPLTSQRTPTSIRSPKSAPPATRS